MPLQHNSSNADEFTSGTILALNGAVTTDSLDSDGAVTVQVTGTWVATLSFQGTVDGTNWVSVYGRSVSAPGPVTSTAANGVFRITGGGLRLFRIIATAYTSGTATATIRTSDSTTVTTEVNPTTISTANAAAAGIFAGVTSYGYLRCAVEPSALFNDCFETTTLDTVNRWTAPVQAGAGSVSLFSGMLTCSIGTSTNAQAAVSSRPTFGSNTGLGLLAWGCLVSLPTLGTNTHCFWGLGTVSGGWSTSSPLQDGVGFEVDTSGNLRACVYSAGTLVFSQNLTVPPAGFNRYAIAWRNDVIFWYIQTTEYPAATLQLQWPGFPGFPFLGEVSIMPIRFHCISGGSTPSQSMSIAVSGLGVGDTSHTNQMLSDGVFPWRKARISSGGSLFVRATDGGFGYSALSQAIATANNKSMTQLFNTGTTYNIIVNAVYVVNTQTTGVTGVQARFALRRLTGSAPTGGTGITAQPTDSLNPTFSTHASLSTGSTVSGESATPLSSVVWSTDEHVAGTVKDVTYERIAQYATPLWSKQSGMSGIFLRNGEGITIKCETSTTTGIFDILIYMTLEPIS